MDTLTQRLAKLIQEKGIKNNELAEATSTNASTISRILKGTQMPTVDTLYKFAKYFDVSMEYLITGKDAKNNTFDVHILGEDANIVYEIKDNYSSGRLDRLLTYFSLMSNEDQNEYLEIGKIKATKKTTNNTKNIF